MSSFTATCITAYFNQQMMANNPMVANNPALRERVSYLIKLFVLSYPFPVLDGRNAIYGNNDRNFIVISSLFTYEQIQNPQVRQMMTNPQAIQAMMQIQQGLQQLQNIG